MRVIINLDIFLFSPGVLGRVEYYSSIWSSLPYLSETSRIVRVLLPTTAILEGAEHAIYLDDLMIEDP